MLSKEDLWEALQEYPEARRTLIEKGRQLLRKDNLLDEEVAKRQDMEQISVEQKVDALESIFENVHIRLDRLNCEFEAMQLDIDERLVDCLLYTSPSPRDGLLSRMPSSA